MRIKKVKSTRNEYVFAGETWVRNMTKLDSKPILENNLLHNTDHDLIMNNERSNHTMNLGFISDEDFYFPKVVIVSDGYNFDKKHHCLKLLPDKEICVISVNKSLKNWSLIGNDDENRSINFYVANNPYEEAVYCLPRRYFPTCVSSTRTNFEFLSNYPGMKYLYEPTPERGFGYKKHQKYFIDDYRNPVSAALCLSYRFGARKIMFLCCDDSFEQEKPGAIKLDNGLWSYPQQLRSQEVLDAQCFWLAKAGIKVADYSSGLEYKHAAYIRNDEEVRNFFTEED